jgi:hypothetical protein
MIIDVIFLLLYFKVFLLISSVSHCLLIYLFCCVCLFCPVPCPLIFVFVCCAVSVIGHLAVWLSTLINLNWIELNLLFTQSRSDLKGIVWYWFYCSLLASIFIFLNSCCLCNLPLTWWVSTEIKNSITLYYYYYILYCTTSPNGILWNIENCFANEFINALRFLFPVPFQLLCGININPE